MTTRLVVIGSSWGGLEALRRIFSSITSDFPAAIAVAQHRLPGSADGLARTMETQSPLPVVDVVDKTPISAGHVYLAPPDYHLMVERGSFSLSTGEPVMFARPSVDVLFESAAATYGTEVVAVILTGANEDGAAGAAAVKRNGGIVIVQNPGEAARREMPDAALAAVRPDAILGVDEIGPYLNDLCGVASSGVRDV